jgi:predicted transcriptional regulator
MKEDGLRETDCSLAHLVIRLKRIRFLSVGLYEVGEHRAGNLEGRHQSVETMKVAKVGSGCVNIQRQDNWQPANSVTVGVWNMC